MEEAVKVVARDAGHLFQLDAVKAGETTGDFNHIGRLVSFAAIRNRAEVWTIGLDQQSIEWDFFCHGAQFVGFLESDNAGKRDHKAEFDRSSREIHAATEAVKHSAAFSVSVICLQDLNRLRFCFTRVNHHRQVALMRGVKLPLKTAIWTSRGELS